MNPVQIKAFGSYVPERVVTNDEISTIVDTSDEWIYSRSGIKTRHVATHENTSQLCAKACMEILKNGNLSPEDIDLIIVATTSPDRMTPTTACMVQALVGAVNAFAFDLSAACTGFIYALSVAEKILRCGPYKNAIVLGGDVITKMLDWSDRSSCCLFGDGAGGVWLSRGDAEHACQESFLAEDLHVDGTKQEALHVGNIPPQNPFMQEPPQNDCMDGQGEKEKPHLIVQMDGRAVFDFVLKTVPKSILRVMESSALTFDDLKHIVLHQANYRIVEAVAKKLHISLDKFYNNIDRYGNTSAGTIPIALTEMWQNGLIRPGNGDKILLSGFGGGMTWGSMVVEI